MANKKISEILKDLTPAVVATDENGKPYTTFITWLIAKDDNTLRFAANKDSRTIKNIQNNPNVAIEVFDKDTALSIQGKAKIIKAEIEDIPFPVSVVEVNVENVTDNLFPGGTVEGQIPFKHTGDIQKAEELDQKVLEELKA